MKSEKQTKIIQFQKDYIQCYFADGTTLTWLKDILIYYSLKGNRIKMSIDSLHHSQDVSQKLAKIVQIKNRYSDDYLELPKTFNANYTIGCMKKYKIKEYYWSQGIVRSQSEGFEMQSDDQNAKLRISKDLYRIIVEYQQMTTYRQVSKQQLYLGVKNQKKLLLQKYSRQYVQFPTTSTSSNEIEYEYVQVKKQFTIFNLPKRWCPPLRKILDYILANDLISHPFCHIDFHDPDNDHLAQIQVTKMPKCKTFQELKNSKEEDAFEGSSYPLFGKPNHNYKIQWMYTQKEQMSLLAYAFQGNNLIIEKEGFWSIQNSKVTFSTKNKDTVDYEMNLMAFPLTVRFQNQSQRQIKPYIMAFHNYLEHREYLISKQFRKPQKKMIDTDDDLISQQRCPDVGVFKAFKNEMVRVNYDNKIIVTIRDNEVKVIDEIGKSWIIASDPILNNKFGWYIDRASDFFQKIFDSQAYQQRMRLNRILEQRKQMSNVFMTIAKHIQK